MPNTLRIGIGNPDALLVTGAYGAGAVVRLQVAHNVAGVPGSYADVSGVGSTPTIPIVAATHWYDGRDVNGVTTDWYRDRYESASGTITSDWTSLGQPLPAPWPWIDEDGLMAYVGGKTGIDEPYAAAVAEATNAAVDIYLQTDPADPWTDPAMIAEVTRAAYIAGAQLWKRKEAPNGLVPFTDLAGAAIMVARDPLSGVYPMLNRWHATGGVVIG